MENNRLEKAINHLKLTTKANNEALAVMIDILGDKQIPLLDRYNVMDIDEFYEYFRLTEYENIFSKEECEIIDSWDD